MTPLFRFGWWMVGTQARAEQAFGREKSSPMGMQRLQGCLWDIQVENCHRL